MNIKYAGRKMTGVSVCRSCPGVLTRLAVVREIGTELTNP